MHLATSAAPPTTLLTLLSPSLTPKVFKEDINFQVTHYIKYRSLHEIALDIPIPGVGGASQMGGAHPQGPGGKLGGLPK